MTRIQPVPADARKGFYAIASDGLAAAQISPAEINQWVKLSNTDPDGWNAALEHMAGLHVRT